MGGGVFNGQNLLSVTKIIWQSLTHLYASSAEMETLLKMYIRKKWKWNNSKMVYNRIIYLNLDKCLVLVRDTLRPDTYPDTCLIPWQIQRITYSGRERHTLTLLSPYIVFSSLPWLSGMVSQLRMSRLFEQDFIKNC